MYDTLDSLIVAAVRRRVNPLYDRLIWMESYRLEKLTGRITSRISMAGCSRCASAASSSTGQRMTPAARLAGISCGEGS